jgi:hypothetical protein
VGGDIGLGALPEGFDFEPGLLRLPAPLFASIPRLLEGVDPLLDQAVSRSLRNSMNSRLRWRSLTKA